LNESQFQCLKLGHAAEKSEVVMTKTNQSNAL